MATYTYIAASATTARILDCLANQREPVSVTEIADALGVNKRTIRDHLYTLGTFNFVQKVGEHFLIGQALAMIWARHKAALQSNISKLQHDLNQLEV